MTSILDYPDEPRFNINSVTKMTDILAVTIRAWERRYQMVVPKRAENGYRLYSERDVAILRWAKQNVDQGYPISSVNAQFKEAVKKNLWPEAATGNKFPITLRQIRTLNFNCSEHVLSLTRSLIRHDERMAADLFADALGSLSLIELFENILFPILIEIGDRWERGEIGVATEHFASGFIQSKILAIYQSLPLHPSGPKIILGCGPEELHEIGPMMLATLLRDSGYRVEYLGPDVPLDDLLVYTREEMPKMVILSATMRPTAAELSKFPQKLAGLKPEILFGFGGAAFILHPELIQKTAGNYLGSSISQSLRAIQSLVPLRAK